MTTRGIFTGHSRHVNIMLTFQKNLACREYPFHIRGTFTAAHIRRTFTACSQHIHRRRFYLPYSQDIHGKTIFTGYSRHVNFSENLTACSQHIHRRICFLTACSRHAYFMAYSRHIHRKIFIRQHFISFVHLFFIFEHYNLKLEEIRDAKVTKYVPGHPHDFFCH